MAHKDDPGKALTVGWYTKRGKVTGTIGDPLALHVTATFTDTGDGLPDFRSHEWLCQIRPRTSSSTVTATLELVDDAADAAGEIDLLFRLEDTTVLTPKRTYVIGVRAVDGEFSPWTLVNNLTIRGVRATAREE